MSEDGQPAFTFWADEVADAIEARNPTEPIVIKGGISPSGIPHLGNANEIILGHFVAEVLRARGHDVEQVFTTDDRDPLRKLPRKLATLDSEIVELGDVDAGALGRNLGTPYTAIPNPFDNEYDSYGDHFSALIKRSADALGVEIDLISTTALYETGEMDTAIERVLADPKAAAGVLADFQDKVDASYIPFNPICAACGKITETVTDIDRERKVVTYECTDLQAGDRTIEGCGHTGEATYRDGKLPWRFEWVAQWAVLGVDFEPFGKDHAEGSWPSGKAIAEAVFGIEPPIPMVYEWFTLDGQPFSSSAGHVVLVEELLELIERPVLRYFFIKDPNRSRDFSIDRLDQLVDEFDRLEAIYFGEVTPTDSTELARANRLYPFLVEEPTEQPVRIPYRFAAVLGMTEDPAVREAIARKEGHLPPTADAETVEEALARVDRARRWARRTDNEYNYALAREECPSVSVSAAEAAALDAIADVVGAGGDADAIQSAVFEQAGEHDIDVGDLFSVGYRLFLDRSDGPKLGPFLATLDRDFVISRLRREK